MGDWLTEVLLNSHTEYLMKNLYDQKIELGYTTRAEFTYDKGSRRNYEEAFVYVIEYWVKWPAY